MSEKGSCSQLARGAGFCGHLPTRREGTAFCRRPAGNLQNALHKGCPEHWGCRPPPPCIPAREGRQAATLPAPGLPSAQAAWMLGWVWEKPQLGKRENSEVRGMEEG